MSERSTFHCVFAVVLALGSLALGSNPVVAAESKAPILAADPDHPGMDLPPVGRSYFDELFEVGGIAADRRQALYEIPFPFERLLASLNARIAPARAKTALIPLGRSLQRFAAEPEFFASPRVVVAVDETDSPIAEVYLKDRFYLGYQPAASTIEVISYNEAAGRFEFQQVENYTTGEKPRAEYADRANCVGCHQGHAPIFAIAQWDETNANPKIAELMAALGTTFQGVPVSQGIDGPDAFDLSTDRANRIFTAQRLWNEGCGDGDAGRNNRAAILLHALRFRLGGARTNWRPAVEAGQPTALRERLSGLWPNGLWTPSPNLPNQNPHRKLAAGLQARQTIETAATTDPNTRREPILVWSPSDSAEATFASVVREVASFFSAADIVWLDAVLSSKEADTLKSYRAGCSTRQLRHPIGSSELRLTCNVPDGDFLLKAHVVYQGTRIIDGRLRKLDLPRHSAVRLLRISGDADIGKVSGDRFRLDLHETATGLSARLATGERLSPLVVRLDEAGAAQAEISVFDDISKLETALHEMVRKKAGTNPLGAGPFRRRDIISALAVALDEG